MFLTILSHPIFINLDFHMPMILDLSYPLIMLTGDNGCGKSTLLHSIYYAMKGEAVEHYEYDLKLRTLEEKPEVFLFDAEQHNPRNQVGLFEDDPQMQEFLSMASHGQVMISLFRDSFPNLPDGTLLLLDEPEMALSQSNQRRILKMLMELVDKKNMRIIAATHSPVLLESDDTYVINMDNHRNKNIIRDDMPVPGASQIS